MRKINSLNQPQYFAFKKIIINYMLRAIAKSNNVQNDKDYHHHVKTLLLSLYANADKKNKTLGVIKVNKAQLLKNFKIGKYNINFTNYINNITIPKLATLIICYGFLEDKIKNSINLVEGFSDKIKANIILNNIAKAMIKIEEKEIKEQDNNAESKSLLSDNQFHEQSLAHVKEMLKENINNLLYTEKRALIEYCIVNRYKRDNISIKKFNLDKKISSIFDPIYENFIENLKSFVKIKNKEKNTGYKITIIEKEDFFTSKLIELFKNSQEANGIYPLDNKHLASQYRKKITNIFFTNSSDELSSAFKKNLNDFFVGGIKDKLEKKRFNLLSVCAHLLIFLIVISVPILAVFGFKQPPTLGGILLGVGIGLIVLASTLSCYTFYSGCFDFHYYEAVHPSNEEIKGILIKDMDIKESNIIDVFKNTIISITSLTNFMEIEDAKNSIKKIEAFYSNLTNGVEISSDSLKDFIKLTQAILTQCNTFFEKNNLDQKIAEDINKNNDNSEVMQLNSVGFFGKLYTTVSNQKKIRSLKPEAEQLLPESNHVVNDDVELSKLVIN